VGSEGDCGAGLTSGIIGLVNKGQPRALDDWGALSAWGWGASRLLDYFETDKAVDAKRVGVQGHSRSGKAALFAMAFDERFAIGYISSSGQGGAKLHRRKYGETIENVANSFYHWMAGAISASDSTRAVTRRSRRGRRSSSSPNVTSSGPRRPPRPGRPTIPKG
jgi:hypothetical protein